MKTKGVVLWSVLWLTVIGVSSATALGQEPFKGRHSGQITSTGFEFPYATSSSVGEGYATEVGHFTLTGEVTVNVITGVGHGMWTLTAANGDQLFLTHVGVTLDSNHAVGQFTIVGGTGRFEGATGGYTDHITFTLPLGSSPENTYSDVFAGSIDTADPEDE